MARVPSLQAPYVQKALAFIKEPMNQDDHGWVARSTWIFYVFNSIEAQDGCRMREKLLRYRKNSKNWPYKCNEAASLSEKILLGKKRIVQLVENQLKRSGKIITSEDGKAHRLA